MKRDKIIEYLDALTDKDFVDLFHRLSKSRKSSESYEDFTYEETHMVMSYASRDRDQGEDWSAYELTAIGTHDPKHYPKGWVTDAPICQSGQCSSCKHEVMSWAKNLICPVCGSKVYGT